MYSITLFVWTVTIAPMRNQAQKRFPAHFPFFKRTAEKSCSVLQQCPYILSLETRYALS